MKKTAIAVLAAAVVVGAATGYGGWTARRPEVPGIAEARALVASILASPGWDRQMCGRIEYGTKGFSPYAFTRGDVRVTPANFARCRERRSAVIAAIEERLQKDVSRAAKEHAELLTYEAYDFTHELAILIDLNAVEALPLLLDVLELAVDRELPVVRNDVLSTITAILRQERYEPLLASEIERAFRGKLAGAVKPEGGIPPRRRERQVLDPILEVPREFRTYVHLEVTPELVATVARWGRDYLATTTPGTRRGERAMDPWPVLR